MFFVHISFILSCISSIDFVAIVLINALLQKSTEFSFLRCCHGGETVHRRENVNTSGGVNHGSVRNLTDKLTEPLFSSIFRN